MKIKLLFFVFLTSLIFFDCASLRKDFSINSPGEQRKIELSKLEGMIIPLEAGGSTEAGKRQQEMSAARQAIGSMENSAAADADYSAQLTAWSGRLAILEGKYSDAQRLYRQSLALSPGNTPLIILGIRLEGDPKKRLELINKELILTTRESSFGFGELHIEKARALLELQRFAEAAGAFDTAFTSSINPIYRESYLQDRNRAWELRNFDAGSFSGNINMMEKSINWKDCISLVKKETQLFRFLTGGRELSETDLFNRLLDRAFIPYTQDIEKNEWPVVKPKIDETVMRSGAAWFIWHLYAESRADRGLLSRYSSRYATGPNPRSPIADVPPLSPFFDSILGCVETELMSLPDGRNFNPGGIIKGTQLLGILKKLES